MTNKKVASLFSKSNRGLLLDVIVFILNIFLMRLLTKQFLELFSQISDDNPMAQFSLGIIFAAMWILPAAGAVLKRWHFHRRRFGDSGGSPVMSAEREQQFSTTATERAGRPRSPGKAAEKAVDPLENGLTGCLFNPIFYFCLNLVISAFVLASLGNLFFGRRGMESGAVFVPTIFAILFLTILQTYLIYRYFIPPKKPPTWDFLRTPQSELLGDVCLFLNMILFQVFWNMLTFAGLGRPSGPVEFGGRLFFLCFIALLIYFPPRMFYLAEDINKRRTWLTMLLANSPVIVRVLIGSGSNSVGW